MGTFLCITIPLFFSVGLFYVIWLNEGGSGQSKSLASFFRDIDAKQIGGLIVLILGLTGVAFLTRMQLDPEWMAEQAAYRREQREAENYRELQTVVREKAEAVVRGDMKRADELQKRDEELRKKLDGN